MNLTPELLTALGGAIITPILGYFAALSQTKKDIEAVHHKRAETASRRDTAHQLLEQKVEFMRCDVVELKEMKTTMIRMESTIIKMATLLEEHIKQHDKR